MRFFKQQTLYVPTFYGTLTLLILTFFTFWLLLELAYPFLAKEVKPKAEVLVVEGWIPDQGIRNAIDYYYGNDYKMMIVTGVPISQWTYTSPHTNMADATAETMRRMYFRDTIHTVSIPSSVLRDRTYATAVALKMQLNEMNLAHQTFDLYSMGAHARRSHLMFSKVFKNQHIGLVTDTDPSFDASKWYRSSRGFRTVFGELVSYFYARLFFFPDEIQTQNLIHTGRYTDTVLAARIKKDAIFADPEKSPLQADAVARFMGLKYFQVDPLFRITAKFDVDTTDMPFKMPTTTSREPEYRKYGVISFMIGDTLVQLTAYQNLDLLKRNPDYASLFVPFKDKTNMIATYGGGRYLDIPIARTDSIFIDFNLAYNPYCAYDERWSCPIPPFENHLKVSIAAGEKNYYADGKNE